MLFLIRIFYRANPQRVNKRFRKLQLISSGLMALSHGSNDAQKTMGIITLALLAGGVLHKAPNGDFEIPLFVILVCAFMMAAGTMNGGWKIIKTMGHKIIKLKPIHGFGSRNICSRFNSNSLSLRYTTKYYACYFYCNNGSRVNISCACC